MTDTQHIKDDATEGNLWRDRSAQTLVLACVFIAILGTLRRNDTSGMEPEAFWAMKSEWNNEADVILLGDSRTLVGVSPDAMEPSFPDQRILNYAFHAVGYTESYFQEVDSLLKESSTHPAIVLGISPLTLTKSSARDNGFLNYIVDGNTAKLGSRFATMRQFFAPITTRELINTLGSEGKAFHEYRRYHQSGWLEAYDAPEDPGESMATYSVMFRPEKRGPSHEDVVDLVINATNEWTNRGIRVYAFRPPTCEAMIALEEEQSQWDLPGFVEGFEAAGGIWLTFDEDRYHSYDNSHLDREPATRFSEDLATLIAKKQQRTVE
ncbi:MAG: hypothetical protein VCD00_06335 [Candidatus Hydrogenedentota bacterium]